MDEILKVLNQIENRLDLIEIQLITINKSTVKMDNHITFIETIYNNIKFTLYYITNTVKWKNYIEA